MVAPFSGLRLGPYELISPLGAGGMGQVWRARDTRLNRAVAIKFSSEQFSSRVEREARAVAALNHPHICTLYDVAQDYLVMELIDGKPLRGKLPINEVLVYAIQIADALQAAHRAGIVHRDLKPANILVTKAGVKLLDFGIAKSQHVTQDPAATQGTEVTAQGAVLGTPLYMAPEQLEGKDVDARTDIFAFGALLYELITGERAFEPKYGMRFARTREMPEPISQWEPHTPPALQDLVRTCLEKDPADRWQSALELRHALTWVQAGHLGPPPESSSENFSTRLRHPLLMLAAFLGGLGVAFWLKPGYVPPPTIDTLTYSGRDSSPATSPDGRIVAFSSDRDGTPRIWIKQLDGGGEIALTSGPDDSPRFSPNGALILFSRKEGEHVSLYRVSSLGGQARKLLDDAVDGDFSPDNRHIAFVRWKNQRNAQKSVIGIAALDGSDALEIATFPDVQLSRLRWSPDARTIAAVGSAAVQGGLHLELWIVGADGKGRHQLKAFGLDRGMSSVAWLDNRTLVYARGDRGMPVHAELALHDIRKDSARQFPWPCCILTLDVAGPGRLVFDEQATRSGLLEIGNKGASQRWISQATSSDRQPVFYPDRKAIAFASNRDGQMNLWRTDLDTGAVSRLTDSVEGDFDPAFSPDGKHLIFSSLRSGAYEIYLANSDGSAARQITHDGVDAENPTMTADGQWVVYASADPEKLGIWKVHPDGSGAIQLVRAIVSHPEVSTDGEYIAYVTSPRPDISEIRVARVLDGSDVPFRIRCSIQKQNNMTIGRARWVSSKLGMAPQAIAFIAQDESGATGVYLQDFVPGRDTTATRRPLRPFDFRMPVETLGVSPDGRTFVVSVADDTTSVMLASRVPGINDPGRQWIGTSAIRQLIGNVLGRSGG